jgi:hypothetical protein
MVRTEITAVIAFEHKFTLSAECSFLTLNLVAHKKASRPVRL